MNLKHFWNARLGSAHSVAVPINTEIRGTGISIWAAAIFGLVVGGLPAAELPLNPPVAWRANVTVGVPGGIPARTNIINVVTQFGADNTGASDATPAISAAFAASGAGDVIYLPEGRYRCGINLPSNRTFRGAGMGKTILDIHGNCGVYAGANSGYYDKTSPGVIATTGTRTAGTQTLAVPDTNAFVVGQIIELGVKNEQDETAIRNGAAVVYQLRPLDNYVRKQKTRLIGKTSNTLTFSPGLYFDCSNRDIKIIGYQRNVTGVGLEDLTIDMTNAPAGVQQWGVWFEQCYSSWIKNVQVYNSANYGFYITDSLHIEMRGSFADTRNAGGSNGSGIVLITCAASLIEDNITYKFNPGIEVNAGSSGNVIAYNLFEDARPTAGINTNHNPHNSFNLYEGNIASNLQCDGYYGSGSDDTVFRNWLTGTVHDRSSYVFILSLNRFTRNYSVIGNILGVSAWPYGDNPYSMGNPNMGNSSYTGTADPKSGDFWADWNASAVLTQRTSATEGVMTLQSQSYNIVTGQVAPFIEWSGGNLASLSNVSRSGTSVAFRSSRDLPGVNTVLKLHTGEQGFQEKDLGVAATTTLKANFHMWGSQGAAGIPADQSLASGETLKASLYRSQRPAFFGDDPDHSWPAFNPLTSNPTPAYTSIPAGKRFVKRTMPPPGSGTTATHAPSNVKIIRQ